MSAIPPPLPDPKGSPKKLSQLVADKAGLLHPEDTLQTAGDRMRSCKADTMPVADGRKLVGMVSEANPDREAARFGHDPSHTRVGETMTQDACYCMEDEECDAALRKMDEHGLQYLPVVDSEMRIVGMVTRDDLTANLKAGAPDPASPPEKPQWE